MSISIRMDKDVVHNVILPRHKKKNEIMLFVATWMDLEIIILSKVSQKEKHTIQYHLYVEHKTKTDSQT